MIFSLKNRFNNNTEKMIVSPSIGSESGFLTSCPPGIVWLSIQTVKKNNKKQRDITMGDVVWIVYPSQLWSQQEYSSWRHPSSCLSSSSFPRKTSSSYATYSCLTSWFLLSWSSSQGSWEISSSSMTKRRRSGSSYFIMEEDHKILFGEILFFLQQKSIGRSNLLMTAKVFFSIFLPSMAWQVIKVKTASYSL